MGIGAWRFAGGELPIAPPHPDSRVRHDYWGRLALPARQGTRGTTGPARPLLPDAVACIVVFSLFLHNADAPQCPEPHLYVPRRPCVSPRREEPQAAVGEWSSTV